MIPVALTIAGSDPGGGAGIQADLKTFHQFGVYGTSAITLITVQNSRRMARSEPIDPLLIEEQINAVLEDFPPQAVKTGALGSRQAVEAVARCVFPCPLVIDPVLTGKHGTALCDNAGLSAIRELLLPRAALITPNLDEAAALSGLPVTTIGEMKRAAESIAALGRRAVLIKGGHLPGDPVDILWYEGSLTEFHSPRLPGFHTHGTGCTLSAAITALFARGLPIPEAVQRARNFVATAIRTAPGLGAGAGPLNHWADPGHSL